MVALLLLAAAPARAGYDGAAIEAGFCGGGAPEAGQRVLAGLAGAERGDLAWARGFVAAAQARKVPCPAGASPLLNLRSRATYEFGRAAGPARGADTGGARRGPAGAGPPGGGDLRRPARPRRKAEADPNVRAGIEELLVTADIDAPDIARRIVAVQRLAANPTTARRRGWTLAGRSRRCRRCRFPHGGRCRHRHGAARRLPRPGADRAVQRAQLRLGSSSCRRSDWR